MSRRARTLENVVEKGKSRSSAPISKPKHQASCSGCRSEKCSKEEAALLADKTFMAAHQRLKDLERQTYSIYVPLAELKKKVTAGDVKKYKALTKQLIGWVEGVKPTVYETRAWKDMEACMHAKCRDEINGKVARKAVDAAQIEHYKKNERIVVAMHQKTRPRAGAQRQQDASHERPSEFCR
jgi:hypothetical protein